MDFLDKIILNTGQDAHQIDVNILASKIDDVDAYIRLCQKQSDEIAELHKKLQSLNESAMHIQKMCLDEKRQREDWERKCRSSSEELIETKRELDELKLVHVNDSVIHSQTVAGLLENQSDYKNLCKNFIAQGNILFENNLNTASLKNQYNQIKAYLKSENEKVDFFHQNGRRRALKNVAKTACIATMTDDAELQKKEDVVQVPAKTFCNKSTMHFQSTATRGTSTSAFIKMATVGTMFPEPISVEDIFRQTIIKVPDLVESIEEFKWPSVECATQTNNDAMEVDDYLPAKSVRNISTNTRIKNIRKPISYSRSNQSSSFNLKQLFNIKKEEDSYIVPGMFDTLPTLGNQPINPQLSGLWQILGQTIFSIIGNGKIFDNATNMDQINHSLNQIRNIVDTHTEQELADNFSSEYSASEFSDGGTVGEATLEENQTIDKEIDLNIVNKDVDIEIEQPVQNLSAQAIDTQEATTVIHQKIKLSVQPDLPKIQRESEAVPDKNQLSGANSKKPTEQQSESLIISNIGSLSTLKENKQVRLPNESSNYVDGDLTTLTLVPSIKANLHTTTTMPISVQIENTVISSGELSKKSLLDSYIKNKNCDSEEQHIPKNSCVSKLASEFLTKNKESVDSYKKADEYNMLNEDFDMTTSAEDDASPNKIFNQGINLGASVFRIPSTVTKCDNICMSDNVLEIDLKTFESDCKNSKKLSKQCKLKSLAERQSLFQVKDDINSVLNSDQLKEGIQLENITLCSSKAKKRPRSIDDESNDNAEHNFFYDNFSLEKIAEYYLVPDLIEPIPDLDVYSTVTKPVELSLDVTNFEMPLSGNFAETPQSPKSNYFESLKSTKVTNLETPQSPKSNYFEFPKSTKTINLETPQSPTANYSQSSTDNYMESPKSPTEAQISSEALDEIIIPSETVNNQHSLIKSFIDNYCSKNKKRKWIENIEDDQNIAIFYQIRRSIENYLIRDWTLENLNMCKNQLFVLTRQSKLLATCITEIIEDTDEPIDVSTTPPTPALSNSHKRLILLVKELANSNVGFDEYCLFHIERFLFTLTNNNYTISQITNLCRFYVGLCCTTKSSQRIRLFLYKCLYYYTHKSIAMAYVILCAYPHCLPQLPKDIDQYNATVFTKVSTDPLVLTLQAILINYNYKIPLNMATTQQDYKKLEMYTLLRSYYNYPTFRRPFEEVLTDVLNELENNRLKNVSYSLILMAKRNGQQWTETTLIAARLMPLLSSYMSKAHEIDVNDEKIATIVFVLGSVIKTFPITEDISKYQQLFVTLLELTERQLLQEAAISGLLQTSRFGSVNVYQRINNWNPSYKISRKLYCMLTSFIHRKDLKFWK